MTLSFGDKNLPEWNAGVGPKGQTIPKHSINLPYFITKDQFIDLFYEKRLRYGDIIDLISFPYDSSTFSRLVRRFGWKKDLGRADSYSSNGEIFDVWSRESAWMYGWIITDGHVSDKYVGIRLHSLDIDVVKKIKRHFLFDGPLYEYPGKCEVRVYNRQMVGSLRERGIPTRNKTFDAVFPMDIPKEFLWDFIRGAFEGDGCVSVSAQGGTVRVCFCGAAESFMVQMRDVLISEGINVRVARRGDSFITIHAVSQSDALRWLFLMYRNTDASIRMDRKFNKFVDFVRTYYDRPRRSLEAAELIERIRRTIPECAVSTASTPELIAA